MEILRPSCKSLLLEFRFNGKEIATGTGFVVNTANGQPLLISNLHNFTGRKPNGECLSKTCGVPNEVLIWHNKKDSLGSWVSCIEVIKGDDGTPLWHEHPILKQNADVAALPLTKLKDIEICSYTFDESQTRVFLSDRINVVGFPFGKTGGGKLAIWSTGFVATEPEIDFDNKPTFLIDCRSRQGQSGSPVILHINASTPFISNDGYITYGKVRTFLLGVYSGRINKESDLGIVWKTKMIKELVDSIK